MEEVQRSLCRVDDCCYEKRQARYTKRRVERVGQFIRLNEVTREKAYVRENVERVSDLNGAVSFLCDLDSLTF